MLIRKENIADYAAVHEVNRAAFGTPAEANLVDQLRELGQAVVSLVSEVSGKVVGHIMFSKVSLSGSPDLRIVGLAPMAVLPEYQKSGIGSLMVQAGLEKCRKLRYQAVVVLGHPDYYPKFGFRPSAEFGFKSEYDVPDNVFMAQELQANSLAQSAGIILYHPVFNRI